MRVRFRQTGGFGGLAMGCDLDAGTLPSADASKLTDLIKQAKLEETHERRSHRGRDLQTYEIVVEDEGVTLKASFDDMTVPPNVEPLLQFLTDRSRPVPLDD
jgi:hypothetical protein